MKLHEDILERSFKINVLFPRHSLLPSVQGRLFQSRKREKMGHTFKALKLRPD